MKMMIRIVMMTYLSTAGVALASQISGEVPEGITAEDWGIVQEAYLKASNTEEWDNFGSSVAVSGDTVVVGSLGDEIGGTAYVFVRSGGTGWHHQTRLMASNAETESYDRFGTAVAISGDTIVVGANGEDSATDGVNGNQNDNSATQSGAAYVFVRSGTNWSQQAYLKASNSEGGVIYNDDGDAFGDSVAISGDTIVVGAGGEDSATDGVNGNQTDNSASDAGAAYVFVRSGTNWSQQAYLKASNPDAEDFFGSSVAISGNTIVVGARGEDSNATVINGNQGNDPSVTWFDAGATYVFVRNGTIWSQQAYLKASNADLGDAFGGKVAIFDDSIVVGASYECSNATGVNGNQSDNSGFLSGAAYVFVRNGAMWSQQAYIKASNSDVEDFFGSSVAITENTLVVGASWEDSNATGVNGDQSDNSSSTAGAAYVFVRSGTSWSQQAYLKASNTDWRDRFGGSVAVTDKIIVVGAIYEASNATGVNGNQNDNSAFPAGAAYIFNAYGFGNLSAIITDCYPVASGFVLEWIPVDGFDYMVKCSPDLATSFSDLTATLPYPVNSYTDTLHGDDGKCFYKVELVP